MKKITLLVALAISISIMFSSCQSPDGWYLVEKGRIMGFDKNTLIVSIADCENLEFTVDGTVCRIHGKIKANKQQMCADAIKNSTNKSLEFKYNGEMNVLAPLLWSGGLSRDSFTLLFKDISQQQASEIFENIKKEIK